MPTPSVAPTPSSVRSRVVRHRARDPEAELGLSILFFRFKFEKNVEIIITIKAATVECAVNLNKGFLFMICGK